MKLSVLFLAYNHAPFVRQALDGVLMQETDFPFEVVIGEDCSRDNTLEIVGEYEARHPEKVRVLRMSRNLGMQANFIDTYRQCSGEYVAFMDGDDNWTYCEKLQRQVDFIESNPEFSFCFHRVRWLKARDRLAGLRRGILQSPRTMGTVR